MFWVKMLKGIVVVCIYFFSPLKTEKTFITMKHTSCPNTTSDLDQPALLNKTKVITVKWYVACYKPRRGNFLLYN